jgi:tRNA dimethylallyltransferase
LVLGLIRTRPELYERIDRRIDAMIAAGLVDEVRLLLDKGYSPELPTLSAIGYREIVAVLRGDIILDDAVRAIKRATRILVRRQANWFKPDDPGIHWFRADEEAERALESMVRDFLAARQPIPTDKVS